MAEWVRRTETIRPIRRRVSMSIVDAEDLNPSHPHLVVIDDLMDSGDKRIQIFFHEVLLPLEYVMHVLSADAFQPGQKSQKL